MEVTRDIVIDLMPLYESGEASRDTRAVVEEFLRRDPALAKMTAPDVAVAAPALSELERRTIAKTRKTIRTRSWVLAMALLCTLLPFSFAFIDGRITFFMLRDVPGSALLLVAGAALWVMYARLGGSLRDNGL